MIKASIVNGGGTARVAQVDQLGHLCVAPRPDPPHSADSADVRYIFRQFFTDDGTSSGSTDMQVDGSSTAVDFYIPAQTENDLWITSVSFVIADTAGSLNEFSDTGSALTNGVRFFYTRRAGVEVDIHDALKTNFDFHRLAQTPPSFASGTTPFRLSNAVSAAEAYVPSVNLTKIFGFEYGVRLTAGTTQRLTLRIRDDLTVAGVTQFDAIAYGSQREPDRI